MIVLFYTILLIRNLGQQRQGEVMLQNAHFYLFFVKNLKIRKIIVLKLRIKES